jgi:hypothetical protein
VRQALYHHAKHVGMRSRFVYELVDTDLFVSDLKLKFSLPETEVYNKFCEQKSMNKLGIID